MSGQLKPVSFAQPVQHKPRLSPKYVPGKRSARYWSDAEDAVVRTHYPHGGSIACEAHLPGRTRSTIYNRAHTLGLSYSGPTGKARKKSSKLELPPNVDETIKAAWPKLDGKKRGAVNDLADELRVPRWWLSQRARKLGLTMPHKKEPPWTAAEEAMLQKVPLYDPDKAAEIFREHGFNRTPTAICIRAKRLSLSRRYTETYSARQAAEILGVDCSKTIAAYIVEGALKAVRRETKRLPQQGGSPWSIERADLRAFVIEHLDRIDFRRVDKFALVDLLTNTEAPR